MRLVKIKSVLFSGFLLLLLLSGVSPVFAGWEEIKAKATSLGEELSDSSKEVWNDVSKVSKKAWEETSDAGKNVWDKTYKWSSDAFDQGGEWVKQGEERLAELLEPENAEEAREALDTMSVVAIAKLFDHYPSAKVLFDVSYGYAVFDSRKFSLLLHTNQGAGVAVDRVTGGRTYMNFFGAGLAAGIGGKFYQQIVLFDNRESYERFVQEGWEATSEVGVIAGDQAAELTAKYNGGMAIYQVNGKGILIDASLSGAKYWQNDALNKK